MMMEAIKFGEGHFSVYPVFELMKGNDAFYNRLCDSWMAFGYSLYLTRDDIGVLEEKLSSGETELQDILREVLRLRNSDHEDRANLKVLYEALIDVQLVDLADSIRDDFGEGLGEDVSEPKRKRSRLSINANSGHEVETINLSDSDDDSISSVSAETGTFSLKMSPLEENHLQETIREFSSELNSSLPLRHHCEYYDSDTIKSVIPLENKKALQTFQGKISVFKNREKKRNLEMKFQSEIQKKIEEFERRNKDCKEKSETFLKELVRDVCKYFKSTSEAQFLLAPEMDLKRAQKLLETGKEMAIKYFDSHSSYGYAGLYDNQKQELGQELDKLEGEMLEQQRRHLERQSEGEAKTAAERLKRIVLDMLKQVPLNPSKRIKIKKVEDVQKYLMANGGNLMIGKHGEIYSELLRFEAEGSLPAEDITRWAAGLEMEVQSDFETPDNPLEQETEGDRFQITSNDKLEFTEDTIKEVVEVIDESPDLETSQEMDIDIKLELEGLVLQRSCEKPDFTVKRSHHHIKQEGSTNYPSGDQGDVRISKRQRLSESLATAIYHTRDEGEFSSTSIPEDSNGLNIPDKNGNFPLLLSIRSGESFACIKKMLDDGANVNVQVQNKYRKANAAHEVISSLILGRRSLSSTLAVLNLLVNQGFSLINGKDYKGFTPFSLAIYTKNLNEKLMEWFFNNAANFNDEDENGDSVLFKAIESNYGPEIIRKILDFGGNLNHVSRCGSNALHVAAASSNASAVEFLINHLDVNAVDITGCNPLHYLFGGVRFDYDYEISDCVDCLEMLLSKGADFGAVSQEGWFPLVKWIKCFCDPYPVLMRCDERLPFTPEIASRALTAMVLRLNGNMAIEYFRSFAKYFKFLIVEKKAELRLKAETIWSSANWEELEKILLTPRFFDKLRTIGGIQWKGHLIRMEAKDLGKLNFHSKSSSVCVPIETVLLCLLAFKNGGDFGRMCDFLESFCECRVLT